MVGSNWFTEKLGLESKTHFKPLGRRIDGNETEKFLTQDVVLEPCMFILSPLLIIGPSVLRMTVTLEPYTMLSNWTSKKSCLMLSQCQMKEFRIYYWLKLLPVDAEIMVIWFDFFSCSWAANIELPFELLKFLYVLILAREKDANRWRTSFGGYRMVDKGWY